MNQTTNTPALRVGDYVRVVIEGHVTEDREHGFSIGEGGLQHWVIKDSPITHSVDVIRGVLPTLPDDVHAIKDRDGDVWLRNVEADTWSWRDLTKTLAYLHAELAPLYPLRADVNPL